MVSEKRKKLIAKETMQMIGVILEGLGSKHDVYVDALIEIEIQEPKGKWQKRKKAK